MRRSGILYHITSLPSPYGIGSIGRHAREFVKFLVEAGQSCWQILPLCPTSYGDSPYQSFSTFAGNANLIDLDDLVNEGLLSREECRAVNWGSDPLRVDYDAVSENKNKLLRKAFRRFAANVSTDYADFCEAESAWLDDYALFMAIKRGCGNASWDTWDDGLRLRDPDALQRARTEYATDMELQKFIQYQFYKQWTALKEYANNRGIKIIGDLPIYVAADSADVWASPELFMLDKDCKPIDVAGCPPDCFTADGQLWGNPLYDWERMERDDYSWWVRRIKQCSRLYDITRIDHFRGFEAYYAIPYGMPNARIGEWRKGPGLKLFRAVEKQLGKQDIIAEDLGFLTPSVREMLAESGYPGMKVLQFAFDPNGDSDYLPHNYPRNCFVYTGTHDNDTVNGWAKTAAPGDVRFARDYLRTRHGEQLAWPMMAAAMASPADTCILTMQDLLGLGSEARMNTPSTVGGNWAWRAPDGALTAKLASRLRRMTDVYRRIPGKYQTSDTDENAPETETEAETKAEAAESSKD